MTELEENTAIATHPQWWLWLEKTLIGVLAIGWLVKLFFWATPINILYKLGMNKNYIIVEVVVSMILGGTLLMLISYQRQRFTSERMFWGTAVAAGGLATIQLLVLLVLGIAAKYFGLGS